MIASGRSGRERDGGEAGTRVEDPLAANRGSCISNKETIESCRRRMRGEGSEEERECVCGQHCRGG